MVNDERGNTQDAVQPRSSFVTPDPANNGEPIMNRRILGILVGLLAYGVVASGADQPVIATNSLVTVGVSKSVSGTNAPAADSPITVQRKRADSLRDPAEAVRAYERLERLAATSEPETVAYALLQQGIWRQREQRLSEAVTIWQRLRRFHPQSPQAATALLLEANAAATPAQGERLREELLAKYPNSPETATVLCERGQSAFDRQDYATAVKWWEQLVTRFPRHAKVVPVSKSLEIARLAATGKQEEADGLALVARADKLYDKAEFALAETLYRQALGRLGERDEEAGRVSLRLAQCAFLQGRAEEAFALLQKMATRKPLEAPVLLGQIVVQSASRQEFDPLRERATQLLLCQYPKEFVAQQALFVAGAVAFGRGNRTAASNSWAQLLVRYPQTGFRQAVETQLRPVAARKPAPPAKPKPEPKPQPPTAKELAERKAAQRRQQEAEVAKLAAAWGNGWASVEQRAEVALDLAHAYLVLNQHDNAARIYQWIWQEAPQSRHADMAVFEAAQDCLRMADEKKAVEHLAYLINRFTQSPLRPVALYCLGNRQVLYHADTKAAWTYYQQLIQEYPEHGLTERTRKFWTALSKLPPEKLREQVAEFLEQHKTKPQT
jgi:tetratricopeptide (TPR) repeat protein